MLVGTKLSKLGSIQLSEHLKSPTEMIESWIETHFNKSQKY